MATFRALEVTKAREDPTLSQTQDIRPMVEVLPLTMAPTVYEGIP